MNIARVREANGRVSWVLVDPDGEKAQRIRSPLSQWVSDITKGGAAFLDVEEDSLALRAVHLVPPIEPIARIFGVGLNYLSHLTRLGRTTLPPHTIGYIKPQSALVDPGGIIAYPAVTAQLDYEIELVAVVGCCLEETTDPTQCLIGYTIGNDVSARDAGKTLGALDLFTQKALDGTAPVGPWITTLDACGGPGQPQLDMTLRINGELRQSDNTRNMIFSMAELLNFVDARVKLQPGDLLFTGSTCGVGLEDGRFLKPGDTIEAEICPIGTLRNVVGPKHPLRANRHLGRLGIP